MRGEQWYSTDDGMKLFGKIFGALKQQFAINGTSRSTETHDISISIKIHNQDYSVDFQSDFPEGKAFLTSLRSGEPVEIELCKDNSNETKTKATKDPKQSKASLDGESKKKQKYSKKQSGKKITPMEDKKGKKDSLDENEGKKEGEDEEEKEEENEEQDEEEDEKKSPLSEHEADQKPLDADTIVQLLVQGILRLTSRGSNPGGTGGSCSGNKGGSNSGGRGGSHSGDSGGSNSGGRVDTKYGPTVHESSLWFQYALTKHNQIFSFLFWATDVAGLSMRPGLQIPFYYDKLPLVHGLARNINSSKSICSFTFLEVKTLHTAGDNSLKLYRGNRRANVDCL